MKHVVKQSILQSCKKQQRMESEPKSKNQNTNNINRNIQQMESEREILTAFSRAPGST